MNPLSSRMSSKTERVLSGAKHTISDERASLNPNTIKSLEYCKSYYERESSLIRRTTRSVLFLQKFHGFCDDFRGVVSSVDIANNHTIIVSPSKALSLREPIRLHHPTSLCRHLHSLQ